MIKVTKFQGGEIALNAELIEIVEETPDTVITLTNGKKLLVKENMNEVVNRILEYRRHLLRGIRE